MNKLLNLLKNKFLISVAVAVFFTMALVPVAMGQAPDPEDTFGMDPVETGIGGSLGNQDLRTTVASIINVALSLLGIVAVIIVLIGGFQWMTAGGNEEKVTGARKVIFSGIIGLAIIMSAWAITRFVIGSLQSATQSGSLPPAL